jgi:prepilin-type N-terminal cleavage/methylation domain-containing protein
MRLSTSNLSRVNWQLKKGKRVACPAWRGGFTLLEVIVAMSIGLIVIGVAVLSITGVQDENQLRRLATDVEGQVRSALFEAMSSQRPVRLALDGGLGGDGRVLVKRYGEGKFREARRGEFWEFSPTGVCEPIEVRIQHALGQIELAFDPLTGMARRRGIIVGG